MNDEEFLYDRTLKLVQSNESLYDHWENPIASYMSKRWEEAFALASQFSGSDNPTTLEVADMGADAVNDEDKFLDDLRGVFRTLAKGCRLNSSGEWC